MRNIQKLYRRKREIWIGSEENKMAEIIDSQLACLFFLYLPTTQI